MSRDETTTEYAGRLIRAMLILAVAVSSTPTRAHAAIEDSCAETQIVLLVDQSGSMGGSTLHPRPNDPLGLRFFGPTFVARWLGNDFLISRGIPGWSPVKYQLAVVNFGNVPEVVLPWQPLAPKNQDAWNLQVAAIEQMLAASEEDLGDTNFAAAFAVAADQFDQLGRQSGGCPARVVLLMTDGEPSVEGVSYGDHMREVEAIVDERMPGYLVYVSAISDPGVPEAWNRMEPSWKRISDDDANLDVPRAALTVTDDELSARLVDILLDLRPGVELPDPIAPGTDYVVPPYLQTLCFILTKRDLESDHLVISDGNGRLDRSREDYEVKIAGLEEPIEMLCVQRPLPGIWEVDVTSDMADLEIRPFIIPTAGKLITPVGDEAVQFTNTEIEFQLVDADGVPLPDYSEPIYQLRTDAEVKFGGGNEGLPLQLQTGQQHVLRSNFIPIESGDHVLDVRAVTQDLSNSAVVVADGPVGEFQVQPVEMVVVGGSERRSSASGCPIQVGDRELIRFQLQTTAGGKPVSAALPMSWLGEFTGPNSSEALSVNGPDSESRYETELSFTEPGQVTVTIGGYIELSGGEKKQVLDYERVHSVSDARRLSAAVQVLHSERAPVWLKLLRILRLAPTDPTVQIGRTPWMTYRPLELEILVETEDGTPIDPSEVFVGFGTDPITVSVIESLASESQLVGLEQGKSDGSYRATVDGLRLGSYRIQLDFTDGLQTACGLALPSSSSVAIKRVENPFIRLLQLLALAAIGWVVRIFCLRRNACRGFITVLGPDGRMVHGWYQELSGRNRWVLKGLPDECGIRKLEVRSSDGLCGFRPLKDERIRATVWPLLSTGGATDEYERILLPAERWINEALPACTVIYVVDEDHLKGLR